MVVKLDKETHKYHDENGRRLPGFSEIMSCVGTRQDADSPWRSVGGGEFCANEIAQDFGHAFHDYAAYRLRGVECDYDPELQPWVNGFEKFLTDNPQILTDGKELHVEESIGSNFYGYAGTPDLFFFGDKKHHLYDWKTATAMQWQKWRMQTAAYAEIVQEQYGCGAIHRHSVRIFEDGYQEDVRKNNPEDWYSWLAILNTYKKGIAG